jgi:hypothetical protein
MAGRPKSKIPCPNQAAGCTKTFGAREIKAGAIQRHLKECGARPKKRRKK